MTVKRLILVLTLLLASCAVSDKVSDATGTSLEQRCRDYRVIVAGFVERERTGNLSPSESTALGIARAMLSNCPKVE